MCIQKVKQYTATIKNVNQGIYEIAKGVNPFEREGEIPKWRVSSTRHFGKALYKCASLEGTKVTNDGQRGPARYLHLNNGKN